MFVVEDPSGILPDEILLVCSSTGIAYKDRSMNIIDRLQWGSVINFYIERQFHSKGAELMDLLVVYIAKRGRYIFEVEDGQAATVLLRRYLPKCGRRERGFDAEQTKQIKALFQGKAVQLSHTISTKLIPLSS